MRRFVPLQPSTMPPLDDQTAQPWIIERFFRIQHFLEDSQAAFQRITLGQAPNGSGDSIPVGFAGLLKDYLYLPGRTAEGNTVIGLDASPSVVIRSGGDPPVDGALGNPPLRLSMGATGLLDFRPFNFGGTFEVALTGPTGAGLPVFFPSSDGTSGFRITSTTNRTFLQCGLRLISGNVQNDSMTVGAAGARVGTTIAYEFKNITMSNSSSQMGDGSAITVGTTRVGVGVRPDDYSGAGWAVPFVARSTQTSTPAINGEVNADFAAAIGVALRAPSTGFSPNKVLGPILATLEEDRTNTTYGSFGLYNSGTWRGSLTLQSAGGADRLTLVDGSSRLLYQGVVAAAFADSASSTVEIFGDTQSSNRHVTLSSAGGNKFSRLGISATSVILGPATIGVLPAPVSSRILTVVDATGAVLDYVGLNGELSITPNADVISLLVQPSTGAVSQTFQVNDDASVAAFAVKNDPGDLTQSVFCRRLRIDNNTGIAGGTSAILNTSGIITADRTFSFPDANGQFLIRVGSVAVAPRTTATSGTIITTALNASPSTWLINGYGNCTVAGTGNVQVSILFTDNVGAKTLVAATIDMTTTTNPTGTFSVAVRTAAATAITYSTTVVTTGTYSLVIRGSQL